MSRTPQLRAALALTLLLPAAPARAEFGDHLTLADPWYPAQWMLENTGQDWPFGCVPGSTCAPGTPGADMDWGMAFDAGFDGTGAIIALGAPRVEPLDSGTGTVKCLNGDIASQLWVNPNEDPNNGIDDDGNGCVDDVHGCNFSSMDGDVCVQSGTGSHDTHVARFALGAANTFQGVGAAPGARLMLLFWPEEGNGAHRVFYQQVLPYARDQGVSVIFVPYTGIPVNDSGSGLEAACEDASTATVGGPPIDRHAILSDPTMPSVIWGEVDPVSVGQAQYPTCDDATLGVAHTDQDDLWQVSSPFSDVAAPGTRIAANNVAPSWAIGWAAGAMALLAAQDPNGTNAERMQKLKEGAEKVGPLAYDPNGRNDEYGFGRIDVFASLNLGDIDGDGVAGDGDGSGTAGDFLCNGGGVGCDDNCVFAPNPGQIDSDSDGTGNACQCGDVDGDGDVDADDFTLLRQWLAEQWVGLDLGKCNVFGAPGGAQSLCGIEDVANGAQALAGKGAGIGQLCGDSLP